MADAEGYHLGPDFSSGLIGSINTFLLLGEYDSTLFLMLMLKSTGATILVKSLDFP